MKFISELTVKEIDGMQMGSDLMIAGAAWVSTGKDEVLRKALEDRNPSNFDTFERIQKVTGLINYLIAQRHGTPFEHGAITTYHHHPIFVEREFVRHRIGISLNEESARYHQLEPVFYIPPADRPMFKVEDWKPGRPKFITIDRQAMEVRTGTSTEESNEAVQKIFDIYSTIYREKEDVCKEAYARYEKALSLGMDPGIARDCLPVGIYTSCWRTWNPRAIMNFLSLRQYHEDAKFPSYPLWEINQIANQMEEIFKKYWPITHEAYVKNGRVAP